MSSATYQVLLTPQWNAGGVWVVNRSATMFAAAVGVAPSPGDGGMDWHVQTSPWLGTPTPLNGG
eukprot:m.226453 g.226453  ORF g.226453 m.226453 type:complete len:64 (-) comp36219_c0_seq1:50-241(-)